MDDAQEIPEREDSAPAEILEEQALDQRIVPFMGDDLVAARTAPGDVYISLRGMCRALGLHSQGQLQRIQRTAELSKGLRRIPLDTPGGRQKVNCVRIDKLGLWLAGVETDRVKGPFRAKLEAYHEELAPEALRVFLRTLGAPTGVVAPSSDPRLQELASQIDQLAGTLAFLREHMADIVAAAGQIADVSLRLEQAVALLEVLATQQQALTTRQDVTEAVVERIDERTQHLTPAHKRQVQLVIDQMVRSTKALPQPLTYARIYGRLKTRFAIGSYAEVPDDAFEHLLAYLRDELRRATNGEAPEQGQLF